MSWARERDLFIAQTMAFVQSVTDRKLEATAGPVPVKLVSPEPISIQKNEVIEQPIELPPIKSLPQSDVRKEIQNRVAAFQAHQHRFHRERDAYFNSVLTKVRSAIEAAPGTPPS
jgi:hypothetical protein